MLTSEADVISGAFMFLRGEAVASTGVLDENFFMYGEDVDYSYRLQKSGYRNYYYPETRIIHYKGESTKKEDLNYFINFYKAMMIFDRQHFNNGNHKVFILLIKSAIFLRAGLSLLLGFLRRIIMPFTEGIIIFLIFRLTTSVWETIQFGKNFNYPDTFTGILIPVYSIILLISVAFFSGYRIPLNSVRVVKGMFAGTLFILIIYALLPMELRFSRVVIILGGTVSLFAVLIWRVLVSLIAPELVDNPFRKTGKILIVSGSEGYSRILTLLASTVKENSIAGRVSLTQADLAEEVLGSIDQIREVIRINKIKEVIFGTSELTATQIIDNMHHIARMNIRIRIAAAGERFIIGSRYVNPKDIIIPPTLPSPDSKITKLLRKVFH